MSSAASAGLTIVPQPTQPEPSTRVLVIDEPVAVSDVPRLCALLRAVLRECRAEVVVCDVRALAADAVTIEALARLQLTARLLGRRISLYGASPDLGRLVAFAGLAGVLPTAPTPRAFDGEASSTERGARSRTSRPGW